MGAQVAAEQRLALPGHFTIEAFWWYLGSSRLDIRHLAFSACGFYCQVPVRCHLKASVCSLTFVCCASGTAGGEYTELTKTSFNHGNHGKHGTYNDDFYHKDSKTPRFMPGGFDRMTGWMLKSVRVNPENKK